MVPWAMGEQTRRSVASFPALQAGLPGSLASPTMRPLSAQGAERLSGLGQESPDQASPELQASQEPSPMWQLPGRSLPGDSSPVRLP